MNCLQDPKPQISAMNPYGISDDRICINQIKRTYS